MLQKLVMQQMWSALALISHGRQNKDNVSDEVNYRGTILNMRSVVDENSAKSGLMVSECR